MSGTYDIAKTEPIPLTVRATKVITVGDAEGREPGVAPAELRAWTQGIAHNYEGDQVLRNQAFGMKAWLLTPVALSLLSFSPLTYFALLCVTLGIRRRNSDPKALRARRAYSLFAKAMHEAKNQEPPEIYRTVLDGLRTYLGDKLHLSSGSLTFEDVKNPCLNRCVSSLLLADLESLFKRCEAGQFAGDSSPLGKGIADEALQLGKKIERELK